MDSLKAEYNHLQDILHIDLPNLQTMSLFIRLIGNDFQKSSKKLEDSTREKDEAASVGIPVFAIFSLNLKAFLL